MHVELNQPVVGQLWDEASGVLQAATAWMVPLLKLFGAEEGNGLSPFSVNTETREIWFDLLSNYSAHQQDIQ